MKTFKTSLLTIVTLLCSIVASAHDFEVDWIYYNITSEENLTVEVTYRGDKYDSYSNEYVGKIVIPEKVTYKSNNYSVTGIGEYSFCACSSLTNVTIPTSVTSIGRYAFSSCSSLTSVTMPDSVSGIGGGTFYGCRKLIEVNIPKTVKYIGEYAFYNCRSLSYINIPDSVASIGNHTFGDCSGFTSITIPNSVKRIGEAAFSGCSQLTTIVIPNSVKNIGNSAFELCYALVNVTLPDSITYIGDKMFYQCSKLRNVNIPSSVTSIGEEAFSLCSGLTDIIIPNSVMYIGCYAFTACSGLTNIIIPESVKGIGEFAFASCNYLMSIVVSDDNPVYDSRENCNAIIKTNSNTLVSGCNNTIIPNSVTSIGKGALTGCSKLTSLTIPHSVTEIGNNAFSDCSMLTEIVCRSAIPPSCGENVFSNVNTSSCTIKVPKGYKTAYQNAEVWMDLNFAQIEEVSFKYQVIYLVDNKVYTIDNIVCGEAVILLDTPVKEGHTFSGWSEAPTVMPTQDVTVTGTFSPNKYKLTYTVDGEKYATDSITYGEVVTLIEIPVKEGYTFSGWSKTPETMPAQDITIDGTFTINTYKLTYLIDDKVYMSSYVTYGDAIYPMSYPTKEGHTFTGWGDLPETMPANDVTVGGTFLPNKHKVVYKVDGEVYATDTTAYGETIVLREVLTKEGHTFSGWSEVPTTMPDSDVTVEGSFTVNSYTLSYLVDGEEYKKAVVKYGTELVPEALPEKEGYTFSGWSEIPTTMPAKDVTIEGTFTINSYTLSYLVNGEVYKTMQVEYGATIIPETFAEQEGYTFSGWSEVPETMPAKDVTIEGTFTANKYQVVYVVDGTEYAKDSVTYGEAIVIKDVPTKEGHTFSGWSEVPATMPAKDVVIEGTFTVNTYKLTYMVDGMVYMSSYVTYGDAIFPMAELTKEGYTFSWSEIPATMPANDVTVEGSFTINSYTLLYTVDGEEYKAVTVEYGAEIVPEAEPVKEGYTFSGWSEIPATMPAHDVTIEGTFTKVDGVEVVLTNKLVDVYTLQGVKIREQIHVESLENELSRGVYIVNGKKVMVR